MAVSLDGWDASSHDGFRGVDGSFARTLFALDQAHRVGLQTQVNTTVTRRNMDRLDEIASYLSYFGTSLWSVFFLITTGRATTGLDLSPQEYEHVFDFLYRTSLTAPFDIKTTEAQHYRRFTAQQRKAGGARPGANASDGGSIQRVAGINDGKGLVFISHTGDIYPSGFLPVCGGNVRRHGLASVYRNAPLFQMLRQPDELEGKCGACLYRNLCGGSRSRAYALTGNIMAADPNCAYVPPEFAAVTAG
jgi:radical SAM protein with 4Fe4S-binding SPASM domain